MKIEQRKWTTAKGWTCQPPGSGSTPSAELVIAFGTPSTLREPGLLENIHEFYPAAAIFGCSTAGEICGTRVCDDSLILTAVELEHTWLRRAQVNLVEAPDSFQAGERIARNLPRTVLNPATGTEEKLVHVLVCCDGLNINATHFVSGAIQHLPEGVTMTGGLAGGGTHLGETLVFRDDVPADSTVAALGFYSSRLKVGFASLGGWDSFGPDRLITKSKGNILYELDGQPALGLYKKYLGEQAKGLPATGLYFPLSIRTERDGIPIVRSFLAVDESTQSLVFTADIPEKPYARLMKANVNRLIDGAAQAAHTSCRDADTADPDLAILVSCAGRKLVLKQRVEEEVEAVREVLGERTIMTGFYSHGEISPFASGERCQLHNQTMSLTTLSER